MARRPSSCKIGAMEILLREARLARGWTLRQLADATGISLGAISLIERNQRMPSIENVYKFAKALGVSPSTLVAGEERDDFVAYIERIALSMPEEQRDQLRAIISAYIDTLPPQQ